MTEQFLKEAHLELVSYCNYKCTFCTNPLRTKEEGGILPWTMFTDIVDQCVEAGVTDISLHGSGESALYKNRDENGNIVRVANAVDYCKSKGLDVLINSNCFLFTEDQYEELLKAGLDTLRVSFHGWDREAYAEYMKNDGFDKVLSDMMEFKGWNERFGTSCELHSTHLIYNYKDLSLDEQVALYRQNVVDKVGCFAEMWQLHSWAGSFDDEDPDHQMYRIRKESSQRRSCGRPFAPAMEIRANGKVSICCFDMAQPYYLGDLAKESLRDVYFGEKYKFAREVHTNEEWDKIPLCDNCDQLYDFPDALYWTNIPGRKYGQSKASNIMYVDIEE